MRKRQEGIDITMQVLVREEAMVGDQSPLFGWWAGAGII